MQTQTEELYIGYEPDTLEVEQDLKLYNCLRNPEWVDAWERGELENHRFADLFPMAGTGDTARIEASIERDGFDQHKPVVMFAGQILDGRNRAACALRVYQRTKDPRARPYFAEAKGSELAALAFVRRHNLDLRSLNATQKAIAAKRLYQEYVDLRKRHTGKTSKPTASADEAPPAGGGLGLFDKWDSPPSASEDAPSLPEGPSAKAAAKSTGASPRSIERISYIEKHGPEALGREQYDETFARMNAGELAAKTVEAQIREALRVKAAERARAEAEAFAAKISTPAVAAAQPELPGKLVFAASGATLLAVDAAELLEALPRHSVDTVLLHVPPGSLEWSWFDRVREAAIEAMTPEGEIWLIEDSRRPIHFDPNGDGEDLDWPGLVCHGLFVATRPVAGNGWEDRLVWLTHLTRKDAPAPDPRFTQALLGPSRVFRTGALEATETRHGEHPQQLTTWLMKGLLARLDGKVADPLVGSGAGMVAAIHRHREVIAGDVVDAYLDTTRLRAAEAIAEVGAPLDELPEQPQQSLPFEGVPGVDTLLGEVAATGAALNPLLQTLRLEATRLFGWRLAPHPERSTDDLAAMRAMLAHGENLDRPATTTGGQPDEDLAIVARVFAATAPRAMLAQRERIQPLVNALGLRIEACPRCTSALEDIGDNRAQCGACNYIVATDLDDYRADVDEIMAELDSAEPGLQLDFNVLDEHHRRTLILLAQVMVDENYPWPGALGLVIAKIDHALGQRGAPLADQLREARAKLAWHRDTKSAPNKCRRCESTELSITVTQITCDLCNYTIALDVPDPWHMAEELLLKLDRIRDEAKDIGAEQRMIERAIAVEFDDADDHNGCLTIVYAAMRARERGLASFGAAVALANELDQIEDASTEQGAKAWAAREYLDEARAEFHGYVEVLRRRTVIVAEAVPLLDRTPTVQATQLAKLVSDGDWLSLRYAEQAASVPDHLHQIRRARLEAEDSISSMPGGLGPIAKLLAQAEFRQLQDAVDIDREGLCWADGSMSANMRNVANENATATAEESKPRPAKTRKKAPPKKKAGKQATAKTQKPKTKPSTPSTKKRGAR